MTVKESPLKDLSVLVTCYNKLDSVDGFMTQVRNLNKLGCQIVIIDDGSDDGSGEKIQREIAGLQNCEYVRQTNQGSAAARSRAISESDRAYIQFLDIDDYLNIELLAELFSTQKIPQDSLSIFEYIRLTTPEFPRQDGMIESRNLSKKEIEQELLEKMGYWRIIYPRRVIVENNLRFIPTFEDLGGKRFILDDLFWLVHISSIGIGCKKYDKNAVSYGYVKNEDGLLDNGRDFSNQASLFPLATSTFTSKLKECAHPHNEEILETYLSKTLKFHARYIRGENLAIYIKNVMAHSTNLKSQTTPIASEFFKLKLCSIAIMQSLKHSARNLALKNRNTTHFWNFLMKGKKLFSPRM